MSPFPGTTHRVWLKAFWGFDPSEDGYLGFTQPGARARLLREWQAGDLVLIYGADAPETEKQDRRQALGFLEIEPIEVTDTERSSPEGMRRKAAMNCLHRWTNAVPVKRAWRVERRVEIKHLAPRTYTHSMARVIASQGSLLQPVEADAVLQLPVVPVSVFGEPPVLTISAESRMLDAFTPSRGVSPAFGIRQSNYEDLGAQLYVLCFNGDIRLMLTPDCYTHSQMTLVKVGYSNDPRRRCEELNFGFPPASRGRWEPYRVSRRFGESAEAKAAEDNLKEALHRRGKSLGGEFFLADEKTIESAFNEASISSTFHIKAVSKAARKV